MVTTAKPATAQKVDLTKTNSSAPQDRNSRSASNETEKLRRAWRSLVSSFLVTTRCAEKQCAKAGNITSKELEENVDQTFKARNEFRRQITILEAKLLGTAKETEALSSLMNSQPRIGRKRKRNTENGTHGILS